MTLKNTETEAETVSEPMTGLETLHAEYLAAKATGKLPDKAKTKAMVKAALDAEKARERAERAAVEARNAESAAVSALIRIIGKGRVVLGGELRTPMVKGGTAYLRRDGGKGVREL